MEALQLSQAFLSRWYTLPNCVSSSVSSKLLVRVFDLDIVVANVNDDSPERGVAVLMLVKVFVRLVSLLCSMTGGGM